MTTITRKEVMDGLVIGYARVSTDEQDCRQFDTSPYRGLAPFDEEHAEFYGGREDDVF